MRVNKDYCIEVGVALRLALRKKSHAQALLASFSCPASDFVL